MSSTSTYGNNPSGSDIDRLRFELGDTNVGSPLLTNAEYQFIIDQYPNNFNKQRAVAFRSAASALAIKSVKRSLGPQSEDPTARLNYYKEMAEKYEASQRFSGPPPSPEYSADKVFDKNMMANETTSTTGTS